MSNIMGVVFKTNLYVIYVNEMHIVRLCFHLLAIASLVL